ncbi:flippase [Mesobacillus jeotgali]|uniref:flippase n=1 Tax=Mesobacillus jeotgali TaxID=129985 RepID=UPI0009A81DCE|nr:flippase [Mesobacillus jeotgali]
MKLNQIIKQTQNSNVVKNGVWLYVLQIFNTIIPLITLPYVTRILGPTHFGMFSAALNLVGYFQIIVEYGFNLSGVRKISLAKDKNEISGIYSRITFSKILLFFISISIMIFVSFLAGISKVQFICMFILYIMVLGTALQQTWIFQGLQFMKYITIISVLSRTVSVLMIFLLIKNPEHLYLYCILYSLTFLLMGIISLLIIKFKIKLHLKIVNWKDILEELKDGWDLFTTSAMTKIFSGIGITVLIFTNTSSSVGIYSAIQKIPLIIILFYTPIDQVIFPYISRHYDTSFKNGYEKVKGIAKIVVPIVLILSLTMILASKLIIDILFGEQYSVYSYLLLPLVIWMSLSIFNNLLGIQILVASGHSKEYSSSFKIGVIAIIIFNVVLGIIGGMKGIAIAAMLAECILTIAIIYQIKKIKHSDTPKVKST